jgi:hypothetical protein
MKVTLSVAATLLVATWLVAQEPKENTTQTAARKDTQFSLFPAGYLSDEALGSALKRTAAAHSEVVRVRSIAKTAQGRDVWLATLGVPVSAGAPARPAILIAANLEADHLVGSQVALGLIDRLADSYGSDGEVTKLLNTRTIYVVPRLNPDGAERFLRHPLSEFRTNLRAMDRDRDGRRNEDGPDDLNGDGLVTRMRVKDGKATLVADDKDARMLRRADTNKAERPAYSEYAEGLDNDADGLINEDPAGGVNLNRNWPHGWTEFDPEAGFSPASEPEVRALIQFAFDHPEIAVVWTYGLNDNLREEPKKPGSSLDDSDLPIVAALSRLYNSVATRIQAEQPRATTSSREVSAPEQSKAPEKAGSKDTDPAKSKAESEPPKRETETQKDERSQAAAPKKDTAAAEGAAGAEPAKGRGATRAGAAPEAARAPSSGPASVLDATTDGAMSEWAYHQFGSIGIASRLWSKPEIPDAPAGQPAPPSDGEARWLYWSDHVMGGQAFVPFSAFNHPTLGAVEIGGWKPGVRTNPPVELIDPLVKIQLSFLKELAKKLPALTVSEIKVEPKGGGLYQIKATLTNDGEFPTALAQGVRTRKAPPILVRLKTGDAKLLGGKANQQIDRLTGSGGRQEFRWLVQAPDSAKSITLEVSSPKAGSVNKTIELK